MSKIKIFSLGGLDEKHHYVDTNFNQSEEITEIRVFDFNGNELYKLNDIQALSNITYKGYVLLKYYKEGECVGISKIRM